MSLITVSGTQRIGKSTFIDDFKTNWPMFKSPERTYRDIIKKRGLKINRETSKDTQKIILDAIIENMESYSRKDDNIIFDRCPLDNLVYTLWAYENDVGDIDEEFVAECILKARKAMQRIDLMLLIPISKQNEVENDDGSNELRDNDETYREEIDNLFQGLKRLRDNGDNAFFVKDDCAPIIEVFGSREDRITMMKLYFNEDGSFYGDEDSMLFDATGNAIGNEPEPDIDGGEKDQLMDQLGIDKNASDNMMGIVDPRQVKDKYEI